MNDDTRLCAAGVRDRVRLFRDGVQAAAGILEAAIYDPITVNIEVGYGEFDYGGPEYTPLSSYSLGGIISAAADSAGANIGDGRPGRRFAAGYRLAERPVDLLYRQRSGQGIERDTCHGAGDRRLYRISHRFTGNGLIHAALIELIHAMGLLTDGNGALTLFEYTSPGIHLLTQGYTSSVPAYFSTNGGNTDLAQYDVSFDDTLFVDPTDAAFSVAGNGTTLTGVDLTEISCIGYNVSAPTVLPAPDITPTATASNAPAVVDVHNVSVAENTAIPALSSITSVSAPSCDSIVEYSFYDQGGAINGVAEPADQWIYALDTQLNARNMSAAPRPGVRSFMSMRSTTPPMPLPRKAS